MEPEMADHDFGLQLEELLGEDLVIG